MTKFLLFFIFNLSIFLNAGYRGTGKKIDGNQYLIQEKQRKIQKELVVKENLGKEVAKNILLTNSTGESFLLKDIFNDKSAIPWVVVFVYFRCPKLCGTVLDGLVENLAELKAKKAGQDYRLLTVSIDSTDTYEDAKKYKETLISKYTNKFSNRKKRFTVDEKDWIFAVGSAAEVARFAKQEIGFPYLYNQKINEFEHPANFFILTADGIVSRYFYGIGVKNSFDLNLALTEAKENKFRSTLDKILLYCYRFDPVEGGYALHGLLIMKIFGLIVFIFLMIFLGHLVFSKKSKRNN